MSAFMATVALFLILVINAAANGPEKRGLPICGCNFDFTTTNFGNVVASSVGGAFACHFNGIAEPVVDSNTLTWTIVGDIRMISTFPSPGLFTFFGVDSVDANLDFRLSLVTNPPANTTLFGIQYDIYRRGVGCIGPNPLLTGPVLNVGQGASFANTSTCSGCNPFIRSLMCSVTNPPVVAGPIDIHSVLSPGDRGYIIITIQNTDLAQAYGIFRLEVYDGFTWVTVPLITDLCGDLDTTCSNTNAPAADAFCPQSLTQTPSRSHSRSQSQSRSESRSHSQSHSLSGSHNSRSHSKSHRSHSHSRSVSHRSKSLSHSPSRSRSPSRSMSKTTSGETCHACPDDYFPNIYAYSEDTVLENVCRDLPGCEYNLRVSMSPDPVGFAPFVGITIDPGPGKYVKNVNEISLVANFGPRHIAQVQILLTGIPTTFVSDLAGENIPVLWIPEAFRTTHCEDNFPACHSGVFDAGYGDNDSSQDASPCIFRFWNQITEPVGPPLNISLTCPELNAALFGSQFSTDVNSTLFAAISGDTRFVWQGAVAITGNALHRPVEDEDYNTTLLSIVWANFFPDDYIFINAISYQVCEIASPSTCNVFSLTTAPPCSANFTTASCECASCQDQMQTDQLPDDDAFRYVAAPFLIDNAVYGPPDRRRLLRRIEVDETPVAPRLDLFIRTSENLYPYNGGGDADSVANAMRDNNCGVLIAVDTCSNNLQVYVSPTTDLVTGTLNDELENPINFFSCYVLSPDQTPAPFPLTPNVFVAPDSGGTLRFPMIENTAVQPEDLLQVLFFSETKSGNTSLRYTQGVYGFEIPVPPNAPLGGVYLFCEINILKYGGEGPTTVPLFAGKNFCTANDTQAQNTSGPYFNPAYPYVGVMPAPALDTSVYAEGYTIYHFHFLGAPECPAFGLCPRNHIYINQDYAVDTDYNGLKYQWPPNNLQNDTRGIFPFETDITVKLDTPEFGTLLSNFDPSTQSLQYALFLAGGITRFSGRGFIDVDIFMEDGACASQKYCPNDIRVYFNFSAPVHFHSASANFAGVLQHVLGDGADLAGLEKTSLQAQDMFEIDLDVGNCITTLLRHGYTLDQMALRLKFATDPAAVAINNASDHIYGTDYSDAEYDGADEMDEDGVARRLYLYATMAVIYDNSESFEFGGLPDRADRFLLYRASDQCQRRPYTVLDFCHGPCSQMYEHGIISPLDNITAKAECHPNSTVYDDLLINTTNLNAFLASVNFTYNASNVGPDEYYSYGPGYGDMDSDQTRDIDVCNYYTTLIVQDILANGTGYVAKLLPRPQLPQANLTDAVILVTFKTDILVDSLNDFGYSIAAPFFPGVFVDYDNVTQQVHIFGTALGIVCTLDREDQMHPQQFENPIGATGDPLLIIAFFDLIIPNVTRDFLNFDADLISHATDFLAGPYFRLGRSPVEEMNVGSHIFGPDQGFAVRFIPYCDMVGPVIDVFDLTTFPWDALYDYVTNGNRNILAGTAVPIPYPELVGVDPSITFRMGDGIDEGGILGALPIVASVYTLSETMIAFQPFVFFERMNEIGNFTKVSQRFRFALYPCVTNCPGNATHILRNHPNFTAHEWLDGVLEQSVDVDIGFINPTGQPPLALSSYTAQNYNDLFYHNNLRGGMVFLFGADDTVPHTPSQTPGPTQSEQPFRRRAEGGKKIKNKNGKNMVVTGVKAAKKVVNDMKRFHPDDPDESYVLILNFDTELVDDIFNVLGPTNVETDIYNVLGIQPSDLGVYMNLRNTLGALNIFGVCAGALFQGVQNDTLGRLIFQPVAAVAVTLGDYPNDPNINFAPIKRQPDDNDLYLDVGCSFYGGCRSGFDPALLDVGQIRPYIISLGHPIDPIAFDALNVFFERDFGGFFNLGDLVNGVGYGGVDKFTVSGWGEFAARSTTDYDSNFDTELFPFGGFAFTCDNCWPAFQDSFYFDWGNSCDSFDLCEIDRDLEKPLLGITCDGDGHQDGPLLLYPENNGKATINFQWINQFLTPSHTTLVTITFVCGHNCDLHGFINGVPFSSITLLANTPQAVSAVVDFDGSDLDVSLVFNQTHCRPTILDVGLNYTHPVDCGEQTYSRSPSRSPTPKPSRSPSPALDYCCVRNYPLETFAEPTGMSESESPTITEALVLRRRRQRPAEEDDERLPGGEYGNPKYVAKILDKLDQRQHHAQQRRGIDCCESGSPACLPGNDHYSFCPCSSSCGYTLICFNISAPTGCTRCCDPESYACAHQSEYPFQGCDCTGYCNVTYTCPAVINCHYCEPNGVECNNQRDTAGVESPHCDCGFQDSLYIESQTNSMSKSNSKSNSQSETTSLSESLSPTYGKEFIDVCDPRLSPKTLLPGATYQVRDEFVPLSSPFVYTYERMGLRLGALWLTFTEDKSNMHLEYKPGQGHVTLSGYATAQWSLPPNRAAILLTGKFEEQIFYVEMNYTVGLVHTGGLVRQPYGPGGVPLVVQELDPITHLPIPVNASQVNKGYFKSVKHPKLFFGEFRARDLPPNIYVPQLNPVIASFGDNVQMMILSGMGTPLGLNGWFGIGALVYRACDDDDYFNNSPAPDYEHADEYSFDELMCRDSGGNSGSGELMFVIESDCPDDCNAMQSQSPGVYCPIHHVIHSHSLSQSETTSVGTASHSLTASATVSESQTETERRRHRRRHDEDGDEDEPGTPLIALIIISASIGLGVIIIIIVQFVFAARRRRERAAAQNSLTAPLLQAPMTQAPPPTAKITNYNAHTTAGHHPQRPAPPAHAGGELLRKAKTAHHRE